LPAGFLGLPQPVLDVSDVILAAFALLAVVLRGILGSPLFQVEGSHA
jgi:hypothetical protein